MGMYTELVMATRIKAESEAVQILQHLINDAEAPENLPVHPLFATPRWRMLFSCNSYFFVPRSIAKFEYDDIGGYWCLISRADLKNYDQEIEKFIDWIGPYLVNQCGEMIGYSRYEETREPTIYYAPSPTEREQK